MERGGLVEISRPEQKGSTVLQADGTAKGILGFHGVNGVMCMVPYSYRDKFGAMAGDTAKRTTRANSEGTSTAC